MEPVTDTSDRLVVVRRTVLRVVLPLAVLIVGVLGVARLSGISVTDLLRDPSATLDGPWYIGLFSTAGISLWAAAAAICLLLTSVLPAGVERRLFLAGGVVSLILGADDGFLIHETIKNTIGIPSPVTIGLYGIVTVVLFARVWSYLTRRSEFWVFVLAVVLFAVSVVLDGAGEAGLPTPPFSAIIEDIAKFLGIATWTTFFALAGAAALRRLIARDNVASSNVE
jgi:hypothetical protein